MILIAGLGNPGDKYAGTRHNVGFSAIVELADRHNIDVRQKEHKALVGKGIIKGEKVILAMPQTFMNLSGESIRELMSYYGISENELVVIYDDIALDVGRVRVREKGSAGGHNGMKNIIAQIGTQEFARVRVGVGEKPEKMDLADYVLGRFKGNELELIRDGVKVAADCVEMFIEDGNAVRAMNTANSKMTK